MGGPPGRLPSSPPHVRICQLTTPTGRTTDVPRSRHLELPAHTTLSGSWNLVGRTTTGSSLLPLCHSSAGSAFWCGGCHYLLRTLLATHRPWLDVVPMLPANSGYPYSYGSVEQFSEHHLNSRFCTFFFFKRDACTSTHGTTTYCLVDISGHPRVGRYSYHFLPFRTTPGRVLPTTTAFRWHFAFPGSTTTQPHRACSLPVPAVVVRFTPYTTRFATARLTTTCTPYTTHTNGRVCGVYAASHLQLPPHVLAGNATRLPLPLPGDTTFWFPVGGRDCGSPTRLTR